MLKFCYPRVLVLNWLSETLLIKGKSFLIKVEPLFVENFFNQGKILVCRKLPLSSKNVFLWETSFIKEKCFLMENFLDEGKKKFLWKISSTKKNTTLQESSLIVKDNSSKSFENEVIN